VSRHRDDAHYIDIDMTHAAFGNACFMWHAACCLLLLLLRLALVTSIRACYNTVQCTLADTIIYCTILYQKGAGGMHLYYLAAIDSASDPSAPAATVRALVQFCFVASALVEISAPSPSTAAVTTS
jgi:hypothetical protein